LCGHGRGRQEGWWLKAQRGHGYTLLSFSLSSQLPFLLAAALLIISDEWGSPGLSLASEGGGESGGGGGAYQSPGPPKTGAGQEMRGS